MRRAAAAMIVTLFLLSAGGCGKEDASTPPPAAALTADATGYYCGMALVEHEGPKAQVFVKGRPEPFWFSQVRDAVHFTHSDEEPRNVTAFYVTDSANVSDVEPRWIAAADAYFVIESRSLGAMGAPETVPFGSADGAAAFIAQNGGELVRLADIPEYYILTPYTPSADAMESDAHDVSH